MDSEERENPSISPEMAVRLRLPRRFRLFSVDKPQAPPIEGVLYTDGSFAVNVRGSLRAAMHVVDQSVESFVENGPFRKPPRLEWLDGAHQG